MTVREHDRFYREVRIELGCKRRLWKNGLEAAEQELRRALEFGFQSEEVRESAATIEQALVESAKNTADRTSRKSPTTWCTPFSSREVFLSPEQKLALLQSILEKLKPEDCNQAFRAAWSAPQRFVFVYGCGRDQGRRRRSNKNRLSALTTGRASNRPRPSFSSPGLTPISGRLRPSQSAPPSPISASPLSPSPAASV